MPNRHPFLCGVVPSHMLAHMAAQPGGGAARETLEQMRDLAAGPSRTLLGTSALPPADPRPRRFRKVYDACRRNRLPGRLVMTEHNPGRACIEAKEAYRGSGATFEFFARVFGRNSIDGHGMDLESTVHYGTRFENAVWNGRQMVYGDGDGRVFHRFTRSLEVIAHELTHGITQCSAGLGYSGQTGALNEHLSDAFGIMVKQYTLFQTAHESNWLIGEELFGPEVNARAVRSMANPGSAYDDELLGRDPQPSHMRGYVTTAEDNGGVHINSGILNHAFYIAAILLGGKTWKVLGRIWYVVLITRLGPEADFQQFAVATVAVAGELYGKGSRVQRILAGAWGDVGIDVPDAPCEHLPPLRRRPRFHRRQPIHNNHKRRSSS